METGSQGIRCGRLLRASIIGLALAIGLLVTSAAPAMAQDPSWVRVNQSHDWVDGQVAPNVEVAVTLLAPDSTVKGSGTTWSDGDGWFNTNLWDEWGDQADVQAHDTVQVEAGIETLNVSVIPIAGDVDPAADTVCGQMSDGSFPAPFYVEIWGTEGDTHREGTTDASGNYCAHYSGALDIRDGHEAFVVYTAPDGNQVGAVFSYLRVGVGISGDWLDVSTAPGTAVTATLWSPGYGEVKDAQSGAADDDGKTWLDFSADLQPGDVVEVEADGRSVSLDVVDLSAAADAGTDTVAGTAPPESPVRLDIWGHGDWAGEDATSDASGNWNVDLSGEFDVQAGDEGRASWSHDDGHWFQADFFLPQIEVHFRNYDWVQGWVAPNAYVDITLRDGLGQVKGSTGDWAGGDGRFGSWCVRDAEGDCVDIAPGDTVEVVYGGSDPIVVPVVEITGVVDSAADTIAGQILAGTLPAQGWADIWWTREGASQELATDGAGNYAVDFSPYDVKPGHWVNIWHRNLEGHLLGAIFSELRLEVNVTHSYIQGITDAGRTVTLTLRAPGGAVKDETTGVANYEGQFEAGFSDDIAPGDTVEAVANPSTSVYVEDVTVDVDVDADTVCGTAPPDAWLQVGVDGGPSWDMAADGSGSFCADFGEYDIQPGDSGQVRYESPEGHRLDYRFYAPYEPRVRVNQSHDWVDGRTPLPDTGVVITLTDDLDEVKGTYADRSGGDGWFGGWCVRDEWDDCVDIAAGDTVHVRMDGTLVTVPVVEMTGVVDADAETISGQVLAGPYPAPVRGEVWVEDGPSVEGTTDGGGNYVLDFSPFDVREGTDVALWAVRPGGHEVGIVRSALRVSVDISEDDVWGSTAAGATVEITVSDGGVKGTATAAADDDGNYGTVVYADGERVDILPGDTVLAEAAGQTAILLIPDPFSAEIDVNTDTVSGEGPAGADLRVDVYDYGDKWVTVEPDGTWSVWFGDRGDLQPGDRGEVNYTTGEGHEVRMRFYSDFLRVRVNQSHNWVGGETMPGSTIVATVWRDGLPLMAERTDNGRGTGWSVDFCCGDENELRVGDVVEVETSEGLAASVEIVPITAAVDSSADTVSGHLAGVGFPADVRVEVWIEDGPSVDGQTDVDGDLTIDLAPFDLLPGHMVFVAYVQPDGHEVGIIRHGLRLRVETGPDRVKGETAPDTSVTVQIDGDETQTTTSDADGEFELEFSSDVDGGDTVEAWAGAEYASLIVEPVTAYVDDAVDRVWGYGPPESDLNVGVDSDWRWVSTDGSGYYEVYYDWDVTPDNELEVVYEYPTGHEVRYRFGPPDVRVHKWAPVWNVVPGDEFSYVIEVSNDAGGPATDVVLTDTLPYSITYVSDTSGVAPAYDPDANTLVWHLGTLSGWRDRSFELRVRLDESAPWGSYRNHVEISAPDDRNPDDNESETDVNIWDPQSDLWVEKSLDSGLPVAGQVISYRIRYGNGGSRAAADVVMTDTLPADTTFVGSTFEAGVDGLSESAGAGVVVWDIGTLEAGEQREFELAVQIDPDTPPGTFLIDELSISLDEGGENRDNRRRLTTVVETPAANVWVDKEIKGGLSSFDDDVVYRITFRNDGTLPAQDVLLADTLPEGMSPVWRSAGSVVTVEDGAIVWHLGEIPPGGGGQLLLGARVGAPVPAGTVFTNTAEVSTTTPELYTDDNQAVARLGPPQAICVPWIGTRPHRIWSGLETTLKGTARGYGLTAYEWDPGDGSPVTAGSVEDPWAIEARHAYSAPVGTVFSATLTVWGAFGWSDTDTYVVQLFTPIHGVQKDVAIDEGLWYLHKSAERYRSGGLSFAEWETGGRNVGVTASAVQAFQVQGHRPGGDPAEDPYVEDVQRGWNALFTYAKLDQVTLQPAGDPDGDGDGVGIGMYEGYGSSIYESGLAMMALATTGTPDQVARTGPPVYVRGQTYYDIARDMADWFAWGQNDMGSGDARGGWRYQPNSGDSDNSNTQFPVLGLAAAEDNWGITVPAWVKDELRDYWLAYTQGESGGFGYTGPEDWLNVGKTGAGIMDLAWTGVPASDDRIVRAAGFIEAHWDDAPDDDWNGNVGELYAMYAVKKGSQLAGIQSYGSHFWDYEYSLYLVDVQQPDGRFDGAGSIGDWQPMATSWALLILSPGLYQPLPVAIISPIQYGATEPEWLEGPVHFDGSASYHTDPDRELVLFEWSFGDGDTATGTLTPTHVYADNGVYTVTLVITDDLGGMDSDTLLLTVDNVPPAVGAIAAPEDPVQVGAEIEASADFADPGLLDTHTAVWDWGDDTTSPGTVDEVSGSGSVTGSHPYAEPGVYTIKLTVTDKDGDSGESIYEYVVVYDPEGGFVTGGGWIDSPPGAYAPDPSLTGTANFGFVAKYKKGAHVPTGQTEFQFQVADLNFHSDTYDWLVVAGARAQFKGTGTINGAGNYGFMLTALDADLTPSAEVDRFRIKIWDRDDGGAIVYDNQVDAPDDATPATELGGGSIVIHKGK